MKTTLNKVTSISDVKKSKDERNYKTVGVQALIQLGTQLIPVGKPTAFNLFEQGPKNADGTFSAGDWNYKSVKLDDIMFGVVISRDVEPYEIQAGKPLVSSYRAFVPQNGSEDVTESEITRAFARAGHPLKQVIAAKAEMVGLEN